MPPAPKPAPSPDTPAPETKRPPVPWRLPGMGGGISQHDKAGKEAAEQAKKIAEADPSSLPGPLAMLPMLAVILDNLGNPGFWKRAGQMALGVLLIWIGVLLLIGKDVAAVATTVAPQGKALKAAAVISSVKKAS